MGDKIYEETDWLAVWILTPIVIGFLIAAAITGLKSLLIPAALEALLAVTAFVRTTANSEGLVVRFGIWCIPIFRVNRAEVRAIGRFNKRWDGVNWPVRKIADVQKQSGGRMNPGVLLRCEKGDFWIATRHGEEMVRALATGWGVELEEQRV